MRTILSSLCLSLAFQLGCSRGSQPTTGTPLSFYVVSEEKVEGGRFIDSPEFPQLGHIAATPDLVVTRLEAVVPEVYRERVIMVDKDGKEIVRPAKSRSALTIKMQANDAKKFTTLTEQAVGKKVLLMQGETPLMAPRVEGPFPTRSLILTFATNIDTKKIENELKKLVR